MIKITLGVVHFQVHGVSERDGYIVVEGTVSHLYPMAHQYGSPWEAVYEYCCRGKALQNNRRTK